MITLFTTTKKFTGQNKINQLNAIQSWLKAPYAIEIIVFGDSEGLAEVVAYYHLTHVKNVKITERGIPLINHMFAYASQHAKYKICGFLNADILLTKQFFMDIAAIHKKIKKNYLVVGQRLDVTVETAISFEANWEEQFFKKYSSSSTVHLPYGSDFFVFPKGQYTADSIPDLLVGRPGWDNWMIYNARKRKMKTIDLSFSTKVIHQNHDYSHKSDNQIVKKTEDEVNLQYLPSDQKYIYLLTACNYYYLDRKIKKNFARDNLKEYVMLEKKLSGGDPSHMRKIKWQLRFYKLQQKLKGSWIWN